MGPNEVMTSAAAADFFFGTAFSTASHGKRPRKRNIDTKNESPLKYGYFVYQR